jgi:DNA polymerase
VTNVVRCNPPANRTPRSKEIENCLPYLWQELDLLRPSIVVPIGNVALQAIFLRLIGPSPLTISQVHARVFSANGVTVVPMRHPARISNADLDRFRQVMAALLPA